MDNNIYLLCVEKERLTEGVHYHPVVNNSSMQEISIIGCNDLIELQKENREIIRALSDNCEDVMIIPVPLETYVTLNRILKENADNAQKALNTAYKELKKAYEIMGKTLSLDDMLTSSVNSLLRKNTSSGKCLTEDLEIVDSDSSYREKYEESYEDDDYDYEDDEDYDYDDEDEEY